MIDVTKCQVYAIPILIGGDGVYPADTYSWNEFYGVSQQQTMHFYNLQLFMMMLAQLECGTPSLTLDAIKTADTKGEYDKLFKNKKNFSNSTAYGSTFFNPSVTKEYNRIHHRLEKEVEKEVERKSTAQVIQVLVFLFFP